MDTEKNIFIAFILNLIFCILEFIGGIITNSYAIISNAIHDLNDAISIGFAYLLEKKSKKKADDKYTYGYLRYSALGGLLTTISLFIGSFFIIYNSFIRIINPVYIDYSKMIFFAILGLIINFIVSFRPIDKKSINQKSLNLHKLEDMFGWFIILIGSIIMNLTGLTIIDPIISIIVSIYILVCASINLYEILNLFLEKTPNSLNLIKLKKQINRIEGVIEVHDLHVLSIDGEESFLTMHVVSKKNVDVKTMIKNKLKKMGINHVTIEIENENEKCIEKIKN